MSNPAQGAVGAETMTDEGARALWAVYQTARYGGPSPDSLWDQRDDETKRVWRQVYKAALASPRADSGEPHFGYLFLNPDTGHEWSESHPIESGEVEDAENVRPATAKALHEMLVEAWDALEDARADLYTPAQPAGTVPASLRAPDDLTREQIRGRAKALLVKNGWTPGDNFTTQNVVELMATIGMSLLTDPPQDRCAYPECGCDADSVCSTALASHPDGQSAGSGADLKALGAEETEDDLDRRIARTGARENMQLIDGIADLIGLPHDVELQVGHVREALARPAPDSTRTGQGEATYTQAEYDESHEIGHRDGYQEGVQDAAIRAGLDGEYRVSPDPERNVPDPDAMLGRIAERVEALAARPAAPEAQGAERVRHVKRGTEYEVLHRGVPLQIAVGTGYSPTGNCLHEDDRLVIYQGSDGKLWAREEREFDDGRFEPASSGQGGR